MRTLRFPDYRRPEIPAETINRRTDALKREAIDFIRLTALIVCDKVLFNVYLSRPSESKDPIHG